MIYAVDLSFILYRDSPSTEKVVNDSQEGFEIEPPTEELHEKSCKKRAFCQEVNYVD